MNIDFATPIWLVYYYHSIGSISLILNCGTIYLVVFKSSKIDNFRYYMLIFQVFCTVTDFHLTFLMQPIPLFPLLAGFCTGILAKCNFSAHLLMSMMITFMAAQMEMLALCFIKKHQTIGKIVDFHVIPNWIYNFWVAIMPFVPIISFFSYFMAGMDGEKQVEFIVKNHLELLDSFQTLPNFAIYTINTWFILLATCAFLAGLVFCFVFTFATWDMLKMLKNVQRKVSATNFQRHRAALRSLMAQFATSSLCLTPPMLFVPVIMGGVERAQVIVQILLSIFALHSSVNAVVLVATTPPFRQFLLRKEERPNFVIKVSQSRNSFM